DDERGERGPEGMAARRPQARAPASRDQIDAHDLTRAEREHVVGHVPDHHRRRDALRIRARRKEIPPAPPAHPDLKWGEDHRDRHPAPVGAAQLPTELGQIDATEEIDEERDADPDAERDLRLAQRPSCARTASTRGGTVVGREADSSAVSGSFSPWPVRVRTRVDPGSNRPALTSLIKPATVAAEAGSMKMPSSRARRR